MSVERKPAEEEGFLSRWSRRKIEAREPLPEEVQPAALEVESEAAAPALPSIDELTIDSDFRGFFHPKVNEDLRRSALRKLFSDPHFNVMDGLDIYIDDYSKTEAIPPAMLAGLRQAQRILTWAQGKDEESTEPAEVLEPVAAVPADTQPPAAVEGGLTEPAAELSPQEPIASRPE